MQKKNPEPASYRIIGSHPVMQALRQGYLFRKLLIQKGLDKDKQEQLISRCKEQKIPFYFIEKQELDTLADGQLHQGIMAELKRGPQILADLSAFLNQLSKRHPHQRHAEDATTATTTSSPRRQSIILVGDHIVDPRNLGALSRTAVFFGSDLMILEDSHTAPLGEVAHKTSTGASLLIPYYFSTQMSKTLLTLKEAGYTLITTTLSDHEDVFPLSAIHSESSPLKNTQKLVLLIGSEHSGVRPHLRRLTDVSLRIDIPGGKNFNSLNLSVAAGIFLHALRTL